MRLINGKAKLEWWEYLRWERIHDSYTSPPRTVGFAYRDFERDAEIYFIMPVNLIVALFHYLRRSIAWVWPAALMSRERYIYRLGQEDGFKIARLNKEVVRTAMEILRGEIDPETNRAYEVQSRNDPGL